MKTQSIKKDNNGNYYQVSSKDTSKAGKATLTGKNFTDAKGVVYPVFQSAKGKLYIIRKSKTSGKEYKSYLKL